MPLAPKNGFVVAPKVLHGFWASFRCQDGFRLEGSDRTQCRFGMWSEYSVTCEPGKPFAAFAQFAI